MKLYSNQSQKITYNTNKDGKTYLDRTFYIPNIWMVCCYETTNPQSIWNSENQEYEKSIMFLVNDI